MTLEELLDAVFATGDWRDISIFRRDDGSHFVSVRRKRHVGKACDGYQCDQTVDPDAPASFRLRAMLESLLPKPPVAIDDQFDDLLG